MNNFYLLNGNVVKQVPKQNLFWLISCEGIPITHDILINNCFLVDDVNKLYLIIDGIYFKIIVVGKMVFLYGGKLPIELPHIKYLHQLQNLYYSLTGEEMPIKI